MLAQPMFSREYLSVGVAQDDIAAIGEAFKRRMRRLEEDRDRLPARLYEFMIAPWHYDHHDRRALHDMRLRSLLVEEQPIASPNDTELTIAIALIGAYFDRELRLYYSGVENYSLSIPVNARRNPAGSHGDLLDDEVVVLPGGRAVHALEFSRGSILEIVFRGAFDYGFAELPG